MSGRRYRPKRRLRNELLPLAVILALPTALYLAFPSGAIGFRPSVHPKSVPSYSALVSLDSESEAALLASARASWQSDSASRRSVRADLLSCMETPRSGRISSGLRPVPRTVSDSAAEYESDLLPDGVAAESPRKLDADPASLPAPAFPESDLIKLN